MKTLLNYLWILLWALLVIHGASTLLEEWKRKYIHDHGEIVEVKIESLNCPQGVMTFHYQSILFEKKIDARTCVVYNQGQKVKLKHSDQYGAQFLFVNERSPGRFIVGGLEIAIGLIGLLANWPSVYRRRKNFQAAS